MTKFKMTFFAVIAASTIFATSAVAQDKSLSIGIKGGVNRADFKGDAKDVDGKLKYQVGLTVDIEMTNNLYLQTGVEFHQKSLKYKPELEASTKLNPMYLQVPLHLAFKLQLVQGVKLVVNGGPYVAFGLGGKVKEDGEKENIFAKDRFKRLDYGVGAGAGVELGPLVLGVGYDFGLANVSDMKGVKVRNRAALASLGVKF